MSECKHKNCTDEAAECYQWEYCSSTCESMDLREENKELKEALEKIADCQYMTVHRAAKIANEAIKVLKGGKS